jgi:hypothetical protein
MMALPTIALSIRWPWDHFIVHGQKRIENRSRRSHFRGEFLIHRSVGGTNDDFYRALEFGHAAGHRGWTPMFPTKENGIVGVARLESYSPGPQDGTEDPWAIKGCFGWKLTDVRPLQLVSCPGALGFWKIPPAVHEQLRGAA